MDFCMRHSESRVVRISFGERKRVLVWLFMFEGTDERKKMGSTHTPSIAQAVVLNT
jgi:hypothetical protein